MLKGEFTQLKPKRPNHFIMSHTTKRKINVVPWLSHCMNKRHIAP